MLVCTARQMAEIDRETIASEVAGEVLMERAGEAITAVLLRRHGERPGRHTEKVLVVCGKGNNGGDGLVIARLLAQRGWQVTVLLLAAGDTLSADARLNYDRLPAGVTLVEPPRNEWAERAAELSEVADLVVDAVFGTGIAPPLRGPYVALIAALNAASVPIYAVDVPSGVSADTGAVDPIAVDAALTITVGLPKLGLLLPPGRDLVGELEVVDIGFSAAVCRRHAPDWHYLQRRDYAALLPPRSTSAHKYDCGSLLVLAGSRTYGGAAVLTGLGALRSGVGLVTMGIPTCLETPVRTNLVEAIVAPLPMTAAETIAPLDVTALAALTERKQALALGPGFGADPDTDRFVIDLVGQMKLPLVLDADGLSAFARSRTEPAFGSDQVVLTPHAGELGRLIGRPAAEVVTDRLTLVPELARRWGVTLLLKGSPSLIADPQGRLTFNPVGDDALASGGSGDVLTGLIGGLLAQGMAAVEAALLGAYLHGLGGRIASRRIGRRSVLARELADAAGLALGHLEDVADPDLEQP